MIPNKTTIAVILGILIIVGGLFFMSNTDTEEIEIGAIFLLTGVGSNWGSNSQRGVELAIQDINAEGGINGKMLRVNYEDNQGDDAAVAVSAFHRLVSNDVKIILGPNWSPSGNALAPLACREEVLMISPSLGVADFNEECDSIFNVWPHDDLLSKTLGEHLYNEGYERIAILGSQQVWEHTQAEAVKEGFSKSGGSVVAYEIAPEGETDFRTQLLKIKESEPEAIVLTAYAQEHLAAIQIKELGMDVPLFSVLIDDERIKGAKGAFEGTVAITSLTPSEAFVARFVETYGEQPDIGADTSYDAVMLIAEAMRETGSTEVPELKEYLNNLEFYEGESGSLVFDGKGGVQKEAKFMQVKEDKLVPLSF